MKLKRNRIMKRVCSVFMLALVFCVCFALPCFATASWQAQSGSGYGTLAHYDDYVWNDISSTSNLTIKRASGSDNSAVGDVLITLAPGEGVKVSTLYAESTNFKVYGTSQGGAMWIDSTAPTSFLNGDSLPTDSFGVILDDTATVGSSLFDIATSTVDFVVDHPVALVSCLLCLIGTAIMVVRILSRGV